MPLCISATLQVEQSQPASVAECPYVVFTGAEAVQVQASPWNLTTSEASQIATAIGVLWALAWVFRTLANFLNQPEKEDQA